MAQKTTNKAEANQTNKVVKVEMLAFMDGEIREVTIPELPPNPDRLTVLAETFHFGQNDFQPQPNRCSVSVGDVILLDDERHLVIPMGFRKLTDEEYKHHKSLPRRDRTFNAYKLADEE